MARRWTLGITTLVSLILGAGATLVGQKGLDTVEANVNAARTAAGHEFPGLFEQLCVVPARPAASTGPGAARAGARYS